MNTLERYILRQLLGPLGFFVLVLTGVIWLTQSLRIIDLVVNNGQGAQVFLEFTALLLPVVLSIVLQLGALAATVYMLHRLISESEMAAMFATGVSRLRAARPIVIFGVGLSALLAFDTLYLMPTAARTMRDRVAEVRGDLAAGLIRDGRFLNPVKGLTVYIREITRKGELLGVMVQDSRDLDAVVTYTAKRGFVAEQDEALALVMFEGQAQRLDQDGSRLSLLRFDSWAYDLSYFVSRGGARTRKASERFFYELIDPDPEIAPDRRTQGRYIAEGHEQLSSPLYGLALPLIAAAVVLGAGFSRRGLGGAIAIALVSGAAVRVIGVAAKSATTTTPELWPLMYTVPLLAILMSLWALSRARMPRSRGRAATRPDERGGEAHRVGALVSK